MSIRKAIEEMYRKESDELASSHAFKQLASGATKKSDYDEFIKNVCKTHLQSPRILALLYSLAPPAASEKVKHNMLEELGLDEEGIPHPDLLIKLEKNAGFDQDKQKTVEKLAEDDLRQKIEEPLLYGTLREVGLSLLLEVTSFEWMLSRLAGQMATFLGKHRSLSKDALEWFTHHSEVDIRHAEEGLDSVAQYAEYYKFDEDEFKAILEATFRENVFIKRYFGEVALAKETGMLGDET